MLTVQRSTMYVAWHQRRRQGLMNKYRGVLRCITCILLSICKPHVGAEKTDPKILRINVSISCLKKLKSWHSEQTIHPLIHSISLIPMPTYVYETIPKKDDQQPTQFEVVQKMTDDALTQHPDTGEPVRRIISGGISLPVSSKGGDCCDSGCSCG